ncbi:MAG: hypothetical protein AB7L92_08750 [Alphaproteobacteria bacterium]
MENQGFVDRLSWGNERRNDLTVIIDTSALINLAALINPQHISDESWDPNPSLLSYLEHLGKIGVRVVIPESVIFEATGHRANGEMLTDTFKDHIDHKYLRFFCDDLCSGRIHNISVVHTPMADAELAQLEELRRDTLTFKNYKRRNLTDFADRDIIQLVKDSHYRGNAYVVTDDRLMRDKLMHVKNKEGRAVSTINALNMCASTQRVAPIGWLDLETSVATIRDYLNHHYAHDNQRRIKYGLDRTRGLHRMLEEQDCGKAFIPKGELHFNRALHDMLRTHEHER